MLILHFLQYFDLTPLLDNVDTVLIFVCFWLVTKKTFDDFFNYNPSCSGTIEVGTWHGQVHFSSIVSAHHNLRLMACKHLISPQLPWPVLRFYVEPLLIEWKIGDFP